MKLRLHEIDFFLSQLLLSKHNFCFILSVVQLSFINDISYLSNVSLRCCYYLHKMSKLNLCTKTCSHLNSSWRSQARCRTTRNNLCNEFNGNELVQILKGHGCLLFPWDDFLLVLDDKCHCCFILLGFLVVCLAQVLRSGISCRRSMHAIAELSCVGTRSAFAASWKEWIYKLEAKGCLES